MLEDYRNSGGRGEGRLQLLEEIQRSSSFTQTGRALVQKPWSLAVLLHQFPFWIRDSSHSHK